MLPLGHENGSLDGDNSVLNRLASLQRLPARLCHNIKPCVAVYALWRMCTCGRCCHLMHVRLQQGPFQGPVPHRHPTLLPLCSKEPLMAQRCSGGTPAELTPVRAIILLLCHRMTSQATALYKNAVQSPPVPLTPSRKAAVVEAFWGKKKQAEARGQG